MHCSIAIKQFQLVQQSNIHFIQQLIKVQVRRTTVEITVLLSTNHVTQPNYCIVLTNYVQHLLKRNCVTT